MVRLHGRNKGTWEKPGLSSTERFKYLYQEAELEEWIPRILEMARETKEVHVTFNSNYANYAFINAKQMQLLIDSV